MQQHKVLQKRSHWRRAILGGGAALIVLSLFLLKAESLPATTTDSGSLARQTLQPQSQNTLGDASPLPSSPIVGGENQTIACPADVGNSYVYTVTQASAKYHANGGIQYGSDVRSSGCSWLSCENYWLTYGFASVWMESPSTYTINCVARPSTVTYSPSPGTGGSGGGAPAGGTP